MPYIRRLVLITVMGLAAVLAACSGRDGEGNSGPAIPHPSSENMKPERPFPGRIVFQSDMEGSNEIYLMTSEKIIRLTHNSWSDEYPQFSPDGKKIAFSANPRGRYEIFVMNADGTDVHSVADAPGDQIEQAWFPDGSGLAFTKQRKRAIGKSYSLWEVRFAEKAVRRLLPGFPGSAGLPNYSPKDPLMAFTGKRMVGWDVFVADLRTGEFKALTEGGVACRPRFSADGRTIVYVSHEADHKGDIWSMDPNGEGKRRLTERNATYDYFPAWSPDGTKVVFCSNESSMYAREGDWSIWIVDVGSKECVRLFNSPGRDVFPDWHP